MKLLRCPFCGDKPYAYKSVGYAVVACACGAEGARLMDEKEAVEMWNTRYPTAEEAEKRRTEALRKQKRPSR